MKIIRTTILLLTALISCSPKNEEATLVDIEEKSQEKKKYKTAYNIIYSNKPCLNPEVDTYPIVKFETNSITDSGEIYGEIYFSNNYLRSLANCNDIDYKIQLFISNPKLGFRGAFQEKKGDTLYFKVPYDSLEIVESTKGYKKYLLNGRIAASFFKVDEVSGYDTTMPVKAHFILHEKK